MMQPRKQLDNQTVANALRRTILPLISDTDQVIVCRALHPTPGMNVDIKKIQTKLDQALKSLNGVKFFISCGTATCTKVKADGYNCGVAYFIVAHQSRQITEEKVFQLMYDQEDLELDVNKLKTRSKNAMEKNELIFAKLKQAVKDHKNNMIKEMVPQNYEFVHLTSCQARIDKPIEMASKMLTRKKFQHNLSLRGHDVTDEPIEEDRETQFGRTMSWVKELMVKLDHRIHDGSVYRKVKEATYAFKFYKSVEAYVHQMCNNQERGEFIMRDKKNLESFMSSKHIQVLPVIEFDYDYIEIAEGWFFKLSSRQFVECPFTAEDFGKVSPRTYSNFRRGTVCDGGFFAESVNNSFPELREKVQFLNRMYQCMLCHQFPHKVPRLTTVGDNNSGKTSWGNVLFGLIHPSKIAVLSKEKNFGASMITERTELLFIDEWVYETMAPDQMKTILQGGYFSQAVKHEKPRMTKMNAGIYITCQKMPHFGDDEDAMRCRLADFQTKKLVNKQAAAPAWILKNAFECLMWMTDMINAHRHLLTEEELFYELPTSEDANARLPIDVEEEEESQKIVNFKQNELTGIDLCDGDINPIVETSQEEAQSPSSVIDVIAFSPIRTPVTPFTPTASPASLLNYQDVLKFTSSPSNLLAESTPVPTTSYTSF
uniref:Uncharacterized protein n=3 Tax=Clytia hemisphaerica TaxID=252671 RepID=A0A7M5XD39_9CNID